MAMAKFEDALPLLEDFARRKPDDFETHYLLGTVYRSLGNYDAAEAEGRRAVQMKPSDYSARFNLGFILAKAGKPA